MAPTPNQALATLKLGRDVVQWVQERRGSDPQPSFQTIANELRAATDGQVEVTDQTIRLWCATCQHPDCSNEKRATLHFDTPCPYAEDGAA